MSGEGAVRLEVDGGVARVTLDDPQRRNALGAAMFDGLDGALAAIAARHDVRAVLLHGRGRAFCAGFDLAAAASDPAVMGTFIERLSRVLRAVRGLPPVTVAAVHGAAIAGGCALVSACDLVIASATAKLGYPVHRLGVSPAVSIPTLLPAVGGGAARTLLLGGELIDGRRAARLRLAHAVSTDDDAVLADAEALCRTIAGHGGEALRATKRWLNELEGAGDGGRYDGPAAATADLARSPQARRRLAEGLKRRFGR